MYGVNSCGDSQSVIFQTVDVPGFPPVALKKSVSPIKMVLYDETDDVLSEFAVGRGIELPSVDFNMFHV